MMNVIKLDEKSADVFWQLRVRLFDELGEIDAETDIDELELATKRYYLIHINDDLISWGIMQENKIVSIGSLCLFKRLPYKENISGIEGYILNIYTEPAFRGQGFAKRIISEIKKYAIENRMKRIWLNSSEQGKRLYIEQGFAAREMKWNGFCRNKSKIELCTMPQLCAEFHSLIHENPIFRQSRTLFFRQSILWVDRTKQNEYNSIITLYKT